MPSNVHDMCRQRAKDEGKPYPRSSCGKCHWNVLADSLVNEACVEPGYGMNWVEHDPNEDKVAVYVSPESASRAYKEELTNWTNSIIKHTGLRKDVPEHQALIMVYTLLAMDSIDVDEEMIHDIWAVWTMFVRNLPQHDKLVPFNKLDERTKALDKIDMWAIEKAREECG